MKVRLLAYLTIAGLTATSAGCGSTKKAGAGASAQQQISKVWTEFFSAKTPASTKVSLLQNGQKFAPVIQAQSNSPLAAESAAKVTGVKVSGPTTATVTYTILLAGKAALKNVTGTAVKTNGAWQVGDQSFCRLLGLQGTTPPACPKG